MSVQLSGDFCHGALASRAESNRVCEGPVLARLVGPVTRPAPVLPAGLLAKGMSPMTHIKTSDGTHIFYKDWGPKTAQPIVFHHGWPLSSDDWDNQMMFFLDKGFHVIAHDRRGHGPSTPTECCNFMDPFAADVPPFATQLGLTDSVLR